MFSKITLRMYLTKNQYMLKMFKLLLKVIKIIKIFFKF